MSVDFFELAAGKPVTKILRAQTLRSARGESICYKAVCDELENFKQNLIQIDGTLDIDFYQLSLALANQDGSASPQEMLKIIQKWQTCLVNLINVATIKAPRGNRNLGQVLYQLEILHVMFACDSF
jgi:hypothetical protein